MNENHDSKTGEFTSGSGSGSSFMGAHDRMDKMSANAHEKINASAPPQYGTMRAGKKTFVVASKNGKSEVMTQHKTAREAESNAARIAKESQRKPSVEYGNPRHPRRTGRQLFANARGPRCQIRQTTEISFLNGGLS